MKKIILEIIITEPWSSIFQIIGIIVLLFTCIAFLFEYIPKIRRTKKVIYSYLSDHFKFKSLEKRAISADIEEAINESVNDLQRELPNNWVPKAKIKWVKEGNLSEFEDGEMILRLKPKQSQDSNLISGIYFFFTNSIFPDTKEIIPKSTFKSISLQLARRTIKEKRAYLEPKFENEIIELEVKKDSDILKYLENLKYIDKKGFFTSTFLREIDNIANKIRFLPERNEFDIEILEIITHIKEFIAALPDAPNTLWTRKGSTSSYRFLLVKNPYKNKHRIYINRAQMAIDDNIDNLYILGAYKERKFVKKVIAHLQTLENVELKGIFDLYRDYNGKRNGIGAHLKLN